MYKKVSTDLNFTDRELEILEFWKANNIFEKTIEQRADAPVFTFYDGPPTANGKPHIGHILTRVIKDIIPRYKTMKGYRVLRKAGWDTHGLPVELEVEKQLGINGKPEIEKYGIEPFIKKCKESVWKYEKEWRRMSERVGFWADMDNPYITYHNSYIESVWWALKKIWEKGLLYKGHKVVPYCPRCGTSLSSHEVAQGYKNVKEDSIYVKFAIKGKENTFFLAWTTTPWTLPSNVALAINPNEKYVKLKCANEFYIMAKALVSSVIKDEYKISEEFSGKALVGIEYEPMFDFASVDKKAWYVVEGDFVTLSEGTGIVHMAPAFGEDDARVGKQNDLPFVQLVDEQGRFKDEVKPWKKVFVKDADPDIIKYIENKNLLYNILPYEHSYPFCWRCDTPLLYYARDTWFIKMTELRDQLIKNNKKINWLPENIRDGRFGNFLENVVDWGLSRERYWGTPLPVWECECGYRHVIGSIEELKEMGIDVPDDIELHKPFIDNILLKCPKCKTGRMKRVPEVIDCWFDSGSMPFAQWHYPFENKDLFNDNFPADFISEALDQTRGWFYTLHAISTLIFDEPSYKNVIVLGLVQDKAGLKMSKHKGNVVDPWTVLDKQGSDALRWYFYTASSPWLPSRFSDGAVNEAQRKFMGTLWNTYAFYILYANIDMFNPLDFSFDYNSFSIMDKWILSKLHTLIRTIEHQLDNYKITESARALQDFCDDLSNWYVRRSRDRYWKNGMPSDKVNAYMVLYNVLVNLVKLAAPFVPFISEQIYLNMVKSVDKNAPESIHLCEYPKYNNNYIDIELEKNMDTTIETVVLGRSCRNTAGIKNRQPVSKIYVKSADRLPEMYIKKYGKLVPDIRNWLSKANGITLMNEFDTHNNVTIEIKGQQIEISTDDVLIENTLKNGFISESEKNMTVVLDINLDEELIDEGFVREIISKIQIMRKEAGFEVQDHIIFLYGGNKKLSNLIYRNKDIISSEVLAEDIIDGNSNGYSKEWDINGERIRLEVVRYTNNG